ncbi:MAG TPA: hypothetical protein VFO95_13795, partial [Gemmatimonadales bacterium]|nr:hypothetical protein [Gemmatimonadales bacterium]
MPQHRSSLAYITMVVVGVALLLTCQSDHTVEPPESFQAAAPTVQPRLVGGEVFVGAGQIARCDGSGDEATATLLDQIPGTVFVLGDNIRVSGSTADFTDCYGPSW